MVNLLNAATFFGKPLSWSSQTTATLLIVLQSLIVVAIIALILYFVLHGKVKKKASNDVVSTVVQPEMDNSELIVLQEAEPTVQRVLTGISLDLTVVQREFKAGDEFDCKGLVVNSEYNLAPTLETVIDYNIIDDERYVRLKRRGAPPAVYVIKPYMYTVGVKVVTVKLEDYSVDYAITVEKRASKHKAKQTTEQIVEEPIEPVVEVVYEPTVVESDVVVDEPIEEEITVPESTQTPTTVLQRDLRIVEEEAFEAILRYDRSFLARLIQSEDELKHWYTDIKNDILSYKGAKARVSWKRETFKCGGKLVLAKLAFRGKVLCIFLPLKFADFEKDYPVEDASDTACYEDTPLMLRLKNAKRLDIARELIKIVMEQHAMKPAPHYESVDYYMPYEGIFNLINKGLVKRNIRTSEDEAIFARDSVVQDDDDLLTLTKVGPGIYVTKKE